jgi:hypothetical protein
MVCVGAGVPSVASFEALMGRWTLSMMLVAVSLLRVAKSVCVTTLKSSM